MSLQFVHILYIYVFADVLLDIGYCADVELKCPDKWSEAEKATLECTVKAARLTETVCSGQLTDTLDFNFQQAGRSTAYSQCHVEQFMKDCSGATNAAGCKCHLSTGGDYIFTFTFTVTSIHAGGSWDCSTTCKDADLRDVLDYRSYGRCSSIEFINTTTSTPQPDKPDDVCTNIDCRSHCDKTGCICIIFFLAGVFPVCIGALAFFAYWRYRDNHPKIQQIIVCGCCGIVKTKGSGSYKVNKAAANGNISMENISSDSPDYPPPYSPHHYENNAPPAGFWKNLPPDADD